MVYPKGKSRGGEPLEARNTVKNSNRVMGFKVYSDNEKMNDRSRKSSDLGIGTSSRKPPIRLRKLVATNVPQGKFNGNDRSNEKLMPMTIKPAANTRQVRKPLADVSNTRTTSMRGSSAECSKQIKRESDIRQALRLSGRKSSVITTGSSTKVPKGNVDTNIREKASRATNGGANFRISCNDIETNNGKVRTSLGLTTSKNAVLKIRRSNSSTGSTKAMPRDSEAYIVKHNAPVEVRIQRKVRVEVCSRVKNNLSHSCLDYRPNQTDAQTNKNFHQKRHLLPAPKVKVSANVSTRAHVTTVGKVMHKKSKDNITKSKPAVSFEEKVAGVCSNGVSSSENKGVGDTSESTHMATTSSSVTITCKPKSKRRRSYTSSLMEKSKILGQCGDKSKWSELPSMDNPKNQLEVAEYVHEIYMYYWTTEGLIPLLDDYMAIQKDITPKMRGILINWLIEVHWKFELMDETLFLMVQLLDRFLSVLSVSKDEIQLVGITALLLASKYEDYWHPKIKDLVSISSNPYTRYQVLATEKVMLKNLKFRLNFPTPYVFMLRFLKAGQSDKLLEQLAFYLIELCLVEYEALKFKPSLLCSSAIYVARCTLQVSPRWTKLLIQHTHYEEPQLRACADMILRFQKAAGSGSLKVTYEKYLVSDRGRVSQIEPVDQLPL